MVKKKKKKKIVRKKYSSNLKKLEKWTSTLLLRVTKYLFFAVGTIREDLSGGREEQTTAKCEKSWERRGIDVDTDSRPPGDGVFINAGFPTRRF